MGISQVQHQLEAAKHEEHQIKDGGDSQIEGRILLRIGRERVSELETVGVGVETPQHPLDTMRECEHNASSYQKHCACRGQQGEKDCCVEADDWLLPKLLHVFVGMWSFEPTGDWLQESRARAVQERTRLIYSVTLFVCSR